VERHGHDRTAGGRGDRRFIGHDPQEACVQFLALRGFLWDLRTGNIIESMIRSGDEPVADPPRNWFAFDDVVLL
jgi:hypothetical protein